MESFDSPEKICGRISAAARQLGVSVILINRTLGDSDGFELEVLLPP
jgi:hypothetical protein